MGDAYEERAERQIERLRMENEALKAALMDIRAKARFEQEHLTGLHVVCLSLIVRVADAALVSFDTAERQVEGPRAENEALKLAMRECSNRLSGLSMVVDGVVRARVCKANNFLLKALGRSLHLVAPIWQENDPDYRRLIADAETVNHGKE